MVTLPLPQANQYYSPNSKCGTLLPEFPSLANLQLKPPFPVDKVRHSSGMPVYGRCYI